MDAPILNNPPPMLGGGQSSTPIVRIMNALGSTANNGHFVFFLNGLNNMKLQVSFSRHPNPFQNCSHLQDLGRQRPCHLRHDDHRRSSRRSCQGPPKSPKCKYALTIQISRCKYPSLSNRARLSLSSFTSTILSPTTTGSDLQTTSAPSWPALRQNGWLRVTLESSWWHTGMNGCETL